MNASNLLALKCGNCHNQRSLLARHDPNMTVPKLRASLEMLDEKAVDFVLDGIARFQDYQLSPNDFLNLLRDHAAIPVAKGEVQRVHVCAWV